MCLAGQVGLINLEVRHAPVANEARGMKFNTDGIETVNIFKQSHFTEVSECKVGQLRFKSCSDDFAFVWL